VEFKTNVARPLNINPESELLVAKKGTNNTQAARSAGRPSQYDTVSGGYGMFPFQISGLEKRRSSRQLNVDLTDRTDRTICRITSINNIEQPDVQECRNLVTIATTPQHHGMGVHSSISCDATSVLP
jgi:hypothetical protein